MAELCKLIARRKLGIFFLWPRNIKDFKKNSSKSCTRPISHINLLSPSVFCTGRACAKLAREPRCWSTTPATGLHRLCSLEEANGLKMEHLTSCIGVPKPIRTANATPMFLSSSIYVSQSALCQGLPCFLVTTHCVEDVKVSSPYYTAPKQAGSAWTHRTDKDRFGWENLLEGNLGGCLGWRTSFPSGKTGKCLSAWQRGSRVRGKPRKRKRPSKDESSCAMARIALL